VSRIGKQPIPLPDGVEVQIEAELVRVKGPKGELSERVARDIEVAEENGSLVVRRPTDRREHKALHGLTRTLVANMVEGVTKGFEKRLEIQGVGYRAQLQGRKLVLQVGYSHPVEIEPPEGIEFEVPQPTQIVVKGISKQLVGEIAARIRKVRTARAVQGQGHPLPGRVRRKEGGQADVIESKERRMKRIRRARRRRRVRARIHGTADRPRLSVFRSNRGIQAQLSTTTPVTRSLTSYGPSPSCATSRAWSRREPPGACWRNVPVPRGSRRASSTATATATTGGYALLPRVRARAGCASSDERASAKASER